MADPDLKLVDKQVALTADQNEALAEADRWVSTAFAELGSAHLEYGDLEARVSLAKKNLVNCENAARLAEQQRNQMLQAVISMHSLSPGEWEVDRKQGMLVRKGHND